MGSGGSILWLFFSFKGRIGRQAFALGCLLIVVLMSFVVYRFLISGITPEQLLQPDQNPESQGAWQSIISFVSILSAVCQTTLAAKRFHDLGQSGFFSLVLFIPIVNLIAFVALCLMPGNAGPNRFGSRADSPN